MLSCGRSEDYDHAWRVFINNIVLYLQYRFGSSTRLDSKILFSMYIGIVDLFPIVHASHTGVQNGPKVHFTLF